GKGSQGKNIADTLVADVEVSKESDSEPARKRTTSRRVVKKKVTISTADNIILNPDVALELGKSISLTEAIEEEAARQVHATYSRIMTESDLEPARRRPLGVPDASIVISDTSSEGTSTIPGVPDEEKIDSYEDEEKKYDTNDDKSIDLEITNNEETNDEFVHGDEQVNDDEGEEMLNVEVEDYGKGNAEISDLAKADAEKIKEIKDDAKKAKLTPTSSSLFVSSGFGDQFLKLSFDTSLVSTVKDSDMCLNTYLLFLSTKLKRPIMNDNDIKMQCICLYCELCLASNGYSTKRTKIRQNGQNQAREWKEREKSKSKAYTSLMGQTVLILLGRVIPLNIVSI
nr:hypothetical protein [Tanacetum cinerariifolium]